MIFWAFFNLTCQSSHPTPEPNLELSPLDDAVELWAAAAAAALALALSILFFTHFLSGPKSGSASKLASREKILVSDAITELEIGFDGPWVWVWVGVGVWIGVGVVVST